MTSPVPAAHGARTRPLKVGLFLPFVERVMDGVTARWADLLAMARRAEEIGFDSIWVGDHLFFRFPDQEFQGAWEGWSLVAALAAATSRVEVGPLVSCTPFRNPALLAKMADTVDEISGGRLIVGLGAGYHEPEFRAAGLPFDHRAGRFEEALQIIGPLLRQGQVDFAGRYHEARECELRPRGPRPNGPPILIAGTGPQMLRLAARHADLYNHWLLFRIKEGRFVPRPNHPDDIAEDRAAVDAACVEVGRAPATLGRTAGVLVLPHAEGVAPTATVTGGLTPLTGPPAVLAAALRGFAREGISHVQISLRPNSLAGIEAFAPTLELLDRFDDEDEGNH